MQATLVRLACVAFAQADLNNFYVHPESYGLLLMAGFIHHLGGAKERQIFLRRMIEGLGPEGLFYLSFFSLNLKNRLKNKCIGTVLCRRYSLSPPNSR